MCIRDRSKTVRLLCCLALCLAIVSQAQANKKTLTAMEIKALLSGNTAVGRWIDHNYRQYFAADGSTVYGRKMHDRPPADGAPTLQGIITRVGGSSQVGGPDTALL